MDTPKASATELQVSPGCTLYEAEQEGDGVGFANVVVPVATGLST